MEGVLKYQRVQKAFENIFERSQITAVAIETNFLVIGTDGGYIHLISFGGEQKQQFKPHDAPVNCIALSLDGGLTILSCSDNGDVVLTACSAEEAKETSFQFDVPIKCVCFEESGLVSKKTQHSFLAGSINGALIYRRGGWLKQKTVVLSPGSGTSITEIRWRKSLVAWADLSTVRLMDISTQTAICRVSAPHGVLPDDGILCRLIFKNDADLMIAWGASFKVLHVEAANDESKAIVGSNYTLTASTTVEWFADSIICGVYPFDRDHLALLCYTPLESDPESMPMEMGMSAMDPEFVIANANTGQVVYSVQLPLHYNGLGGPMEFFFLSSYACADSKTDANKWTLANINSRGADKGLAPLFFIFSPQDAVVARLVDINDRIATNLRQGNVRVAVEIAQSDRSSLRSFSYHELLLFYVDHLIKQRMAGFAGKECARLVGPDQALWEKAVELFKNAGQCAALCLSIPSDSPRLSSKVYEDILYALLATEEVQLFVKVVKKWSTVEPPLFSHEKILALLNALNTKNSNKLLASLDPRLDFAVLSSLQAQDHHKLFLIEAEASLHLAAKNYDKVLSCYLDTDIASMSNFGTASDLQSMASAGEYRSVFDLIEKNNLFLKVEAKIVNLIRLSKPLSGKLLVNHVDKLPIRRIATALQNDPALLHWYLQLLFADEGTRSEYRNEDAFGDLHQRHLQLLIDFAPTVLGRDGPSGRSTASSGGGDLNVADVQYYRRNSFQSDLISFVRAGLASYDVAIRLCEAHNPPLFLEIIMLQLLMGEVKRGLVIILEELFNVALAIEYIEYYYEETAPAGEHKAPQRHGLRFPITPIAKDGLTPPTGSAVTTDPTKQHYIELWDELIRFILKKDPSQLATVLDYVSYCHIDPFLIVRAIRPQVNVPGLKPRIARVLANLSFQKTIDDCTKDVLQKESVALIAQKNHGQRRAVKLPSQLRCKYCMRPLLFEPPTFQTPAETSTGCAHLLPVSKEFIQIWGSHRGGALSGEHGDGDGEMQAAVSNQYFGLEGAVIFSNKLAFHRPCYGRIR